MGPTLLIVSSIVIAAIVVLLSERFIHRSVTDSPQSTSPKYRSSLRDHQRGLKPDRSFFDENWEDDELFNEPKFNKRRSKSNGESNRIVATLIFMAILIGLLLFLSAA